MITSTANPQIKNMVLLGKKTRARKEQGLFLAEGIKMVGEAPEHWIQKLYVSETYLMEHSRDDRFCRRDYEVVSDSVMKTISGTQTPQGILAAVSIPSWDFQTVSGQTNGCFLFLESIQDPGNLGTILRSSEAAGITAVIANDTTVDLYNPKTVRSTMGSIYRMPFFSFKEWKKTIQRMKSNGMKLYAAHLTAETLYDEPDYTKSCGFLIGNEANGLTDETASLADSYFKIPMEGKAESLNAAAASAVLMYEANRQRRRQSCFECGQK